MEGDHDRRDSERKRIPLEAVEVEHKEAKGYSEKRKLTKKGGSELAERG